ncbi:MAG: hypothetical protein F4Y45_13760 [Acidobacteria bacterium]|nr:hypothetical protein [Acidobacteriota bacterium]MYJ06123.1 hypothetical protein [Acidobacteriota bacterium]
MAVFNNPFNSFHDTVAEAKEEREQLDRLLTISTPRERLLVVAVALFLFVLAAWLVFGSVARSIAVDGLLIDTAGDPSGGRRSVQVLVWIEGTVVPRIETGMPAEIELTTADGEADTRGGEVVAIAAVRLFEELAEFEPAAPVSVHRVGIALEEGIDLADLAGRECRVVIELGRQSPAAFLGMARS